MSSALSPKASNAIVWIGSLAIPIVVALIYLMPKADAGHDFFYQLPVLNATLNSLTFILLIAAFIAIKLKNITLHKRLVWTALVSSVLFLISYILYHTNVPSTPYGGEGVMKTLYLFILLTHIVLAVVIVPLVLITLVRAYNSDFSRHRKIARWTMPLWLYVAATGVIVYLMISPYYTF